MPIKAEHSLILITVKSIVLVLQILLYHLLNDMCNQDSFHSTFQKAQYQKKLNRTAQHTWNIDVSCEKLLYLSEDVMFSKCCFFCNLVVPWHSGPLCICSKARDTKQTLKVAFIKLCVSRLIRHKNWRLFSFLFVFSPDDLKVLI